MSEDTASILKEAEKKMAKSVEVTKEEFTAIRTGRASAAMFQGITADYYGTPTPLNQLAAFQFPEARTVIVTPYDKGAMAEIEESLRESDLGVNPTNNGDNLRIVLPALTEERRKEYIKMAKAKAEEGRIAVRNVRRASNDIVKKQEKDKEISEDEMTRLEKELDQVTRKYVEQIDELLKSKESELLEI
ncbi:MAG: ribosome recycling factor [Cutibacterium avidum]|nr:ribosome recycling factor [Cutibacterium avidum]